MTNATKRLRAPAAILTATVIAAAVVLLAGGPDRGAAAAILLITVPLLLAMGAGPHLMGQATPPAEPTSTGLKLLAFLPALLGQLAVTIVIGWQTATTVADGDVVCAVALIPLALLSGWRGWHTTRRLTARPQ